MLHDGDDTSSEEEAVARIALWVLVGCFYGLFGVVLVRFAWMLLGERRLAGGLSVRLVVHGLLCFPTLARALDMTVWHAHYLGTHLASQTIPEMVVGGSAGYFLFAAYSLVYCFWYVLLRGASAMSKRAIAQIYLGVNAGVFSVWVALVVAMAVLGVERQHAREVVHGVELHFAASVTLASALAFLVFGAVVYRRFASQPPVEPYSPSMRIANQIGLLAAAFATTLSIRSALMVVDWHSAGHWGRVALLMIRVVSQTLCEMVPVVCTLVILWRPVVGSSTKH
jgi:hypothetical protein